MSSPVWQFTSYKAILSQKMSFPSLAFRVTEKIIHIFFSHFFLLETLALPWGTHGKQTSAITLEKACLSSLWAMTDSEDNYSLQSFPSGIINLPYSWSEISSWSTFRCNTNLKRFPLTWIQPYCWLLDPFNRIGNLLLKSDLNDINYVSQVLPPPQLSQGYSFPQYSSSILMS